MKNRETSGKKETQGGSVTLSLCFSIGTEGEIISKTKFPSTRYQGSKLKLSYWIWNSIKELNFYTCLDAFGGTGSISYMLKSHGKQVTYNDLLTFNYYIGLALIENHSVKLSKKDLDFLVTEHKSISYPSFIYDTFKDIYFTDEENCWIDRVSTNINLLDNMYKRALAYFALFQSCIIKRPFNLFHRKNLYIRLSDVKRNFGNKITWDTPFDIHFRKFAEEVNRGVCSIGKKNKALNMDVFDIEENFDLIYIDPPYISKKGYGVDYYDFYHFLEGLVHYSNWKERIDYSSKHKKLKRSPSLWNDKKSIHIAFDRLFDKFKDSILVVSYRSDGIPSIEEISHLMKKYKSDVLEFRQKDYKYVLSKKTSEEVLLIGID